MRWIRAVKRAGVSIYFPPVSKLRGFGLGLLAVLIALGLVWQSPASALTPRHYDDLKFAPLAELKIPPFERYQLANGLVVYLMENHELPLVSGTATFRTGSRFEPARQVGLAAITGEAMRLGGTQKLAPDALNQVLENRAASIETSIDTVAGSASFDSLVNDAELVLSLFADVIQRPAFAPDRVDFLKGQYRGSIARRNDDPDSITGREFAKLIYGADSPYGRTVEYATLESISRQDVEAFYRASIRPDRTILGLEGDFDSTRMKTLVNQYFGDWQGEGEALDITHLPVVGQAKAGLFAIEQPQLTQSYVQLGHLGGQFNAPDYPALEVMNEVLNSFSGRLFNQVRSRQGLAYSVYAFWSPRYDYPGMFIGGGETRSTTTVPFIQAVKREIERIRTSPITLEELTLAKDSVLNSFVFKFQKSSQILARLIRNEYYHYPANFIFQFQEQVRKITASDVLAAAQERLKLDQLAILVVGNSADIQPALATLEPQQPVQVLDITIPSDQKT